MSECISGKNIAKKRRQILKEKITTLKEKGIKPGLAVIQLGEDPASKIYVRNKKRGCKKIGIESFEYSLPESTTQTELLGLIENLNGREEVDGILVQIPLPDHIDKDKIIDNIHPDKDVDGFHPVSIGNLLLGKPYFRPCTPWGIIIMLEETQVELEGKHAVIIGRSNIVGKPLIPMLLNKNMTVTTCHSKTKNIKEITSKADILIAAVGKAKFVKEDWVKPGAIVIDVGINRLDNGSLVGDVDFENVKNKASYITPVPGGVGPMTINMLLENTALAAEKRAQKTLQNVMFESKKTG